MPQKTQTKNQYRATFHVVDDANKEVIMGSLTAPSTQTLQKKINGLLPDGGRAITVDNQGENSYLYHPSIFDGKEPFAWICQQEVPVSLSVESMVSALSNTRAASGR